MYHSGSYGIGQVDILRALFRVSQLCTEQRFEGGILWCFNERTSIPTGELDALNLNIRYHERVPVDFKNTRGEPCLFILDDLLNDAYCSGLVCDVFTKGSHNRNINFILIAHNIIKQSKNCRDISLNIKYLVILTNVRNRRQFTGLAKKVYPKHSVNLYDTYLHAK